jgi:hypothetical protein
VTPPDDDPSADAAFRMITEALRPSPANVARFIGDFPNAALNGS